jgi:hypothetical protein
MNYDIPISINDPERDRKTIRRNFIGELYERDKHANRNGESNVFTIKEIWEKSLKAFTLSYIDREISVFLAEENPDIELVNNTENKKIRLTEKGRKKYELNLHKSVNDAISKNPTIYQRLAKI